MHRLDDFFNAQLEKRRVSDTLRTLTAGHSTLKDFTSNDYLGLAHSAELQRMIASKLAGTHLNGSTGSRLLSGNSNDIIQLEEKLARIFTCESTLIFNSGYSANLGVFSSIAGKGDTILYDELSHASMKDGIRLSLATRHSFRHNDLEDLLSKINRASGKVFIAIEAIYSMDGDICPLAEIVQIAKAHTCFIVLDEAHSTGIFGHQGAGLAVAKGLAPQIDIRIHTFGKAIGVHGACVAGSKSLTNFLVNFSRPFIYTTAPSPHQVASIDCAFDFLSSHPELQNTLMQKIHRFSTHRVKPGLNISPIQTIIFDNAPKAKAAAKELIAKQFDVRAIVSPTVPAGSERLRICLHTFNEDSDIVELAETINKLQST